jgi:hypothetical protein
MSTCGDLIDSADKDRKFLNQIIPGDITCFFYVQSTTEVTINHLKIIITKKEETMTGQVKRQGSA